jgi:V8-like Glu-specific endopeptidase
MSQTDSAPAQKISAFRGLSAAFLALSVVGCGAQSGLKMQPLSLDLPNGGQVMTLIPQGESISPNKIIGDNDLIPVTDDGQNIPEAYRGILDAFGRMSMGCTATHIGQGFVISAGHCFNAPSVREDMVDCAGVTVEWGVRRSGQPNLVSRCEMILAQETNDDVDYVIFKVSPAPQAKLSIAGHRAAFGTDITIFGHPMGRALEWSGVCQMLTPDHGGWSSIAFSHQCDTEPGNSGSAILDAQTLEIVGIHGGGVLPYNYGSFITETPVGEFRAFFEGRERFELPSEGERYVFNKKDLVNNASDMVLVELGSAEDTSVRFMMEIDLEDGFDFLVLEDGNGVRSEKYTGSQTLEVDGLAAPVKVLFQSDASGLSRLVKLSGIQLN